MEPESAENERDISELEELRNELSQIIRSFDRRDADPARDWVQFYGELEATAGRLGNLAKKLKSKFAA